MKDNMSAGDSSSVVGERSSVPTSSYPPPVCPRCDELMISMGNGDGRTFEYGPWYELFVCHRDRVKMTVFRDGGLRPLIADVRDYEVIA